MRKSVLLGLVILAAVSGVSCDWHRDHMTPVAMSDSADLTPAETFACVSCRVWTTRAGGYYYGLIVGHYEFDPNIPALQTYDYAYDASKGGALAINGRTIGYSLNKRLRALNAFGEMEEIILTDREAEIVTPPTSGVVDARRIWNEVVLPRLYRFEGKTSSGRPVGHWTCCDRLGRKAYEGDFVNGLRDGKWTYYYPSGTTRAEIRFSGGKRNGKWTRLSESGAVEESLTWKNDVPVERAATWRSLGQYGTVRPDGTQEGGGS
jgi:hypothetical protein